VGAFWGDVPQSRKQSIADFLRQLLTAINARYFAMVNGSCASAMDADQSGFQNLVAWSWDQNEDRRLM